MDIYAPPEGVALPAVGESFRGRMPVTPDADVVAVARQLVETTPSCSSLSEEVGTNPDMGTTFRGVSFRYVPGKGVGIEEQDRRVYRLISDDFVITEVRP
jgi:hypothetical protein